MRGLRRRMDPEERHRQSVQITERFLAWAPLQRCPTVALYDPIHGEVDTQLLAEALRRQYIDVLYPRCDRVSTSLAFVPALTAEALQPGAYGVREPGGLARPLVEVACVVLPGLAFDSQGGRLGYGAGYYDRTLVDYNGLAVGFAYDFQVLEAVPRGVHDIAMHCVISPEGVFAGSGQSEL